MKIKMESISASSGSFLITKWLSKIPILDCLISKDFWITLVLWSMAMSMHCRMSVLRKVEMRKVFQGLKRVKEHSLCLMEMAGGKHLYDLLINIYMFIQINRENEYYGIVSLWFELVCIFERLFWILVMLVHVTCLYISFGCWHRLNDVKKMDFVMAIEHN